jgi:hypothetical protein
MRPIAQFKTPWLPCLGFVVWVRRSGLTLGGWVWDVRAGMMDGMRCAVWRRALRVVTLKSKSSSVNQSVSQAVRTWAVRPMLIGRPIFFFFWRPPGVFLCCRYHCVLFSDCCLSFELMQVQVQMQVQMQMQVAGPLESNGDSTQVL